MKPEAVKQLLEASVAGDAEAVLAAGVGGGGRQGLSLEQAIAETGQRRERLEKHLAASGSVVRSGELLISKEVVTELKMALVAAVAEFHKKEPLQPGISKESLRDKLGLSSEAFAFVLDAVLPEKRVQQLGDVVSLSGREIVMKDEEAESKKIIETAFASAGLKVPALKEVLAGLKVDKTRAQKIVTLLLRDKTLVKISDELVFHRDALMDLRTRVTGEKSRSPKMDVARFKELSGVSRKYAIPLLEYLDRERVTRRVGDERIIL